jgi:MinD-like ATPase involved in chromosome partitioning or flagellar assembly
MLPSQPAPTTTTPPLASPPATAPQAGSWAEPLPVPHEFGPVDVADRAWRQAAAVRFASTIAVSSADGGVGRSTLVAALGSVLALAVPGPVVAVDMHPVPWGGLGDRIGRQNAGTIWDAVRDLEQLTSLREISRWAQRGPTGLLALVGETEGAGRRPPRHDEGAAVARAVARQVPLTVCDVMPALIVGVWQTLSAATVPLLVARASADSVQHTLRLLTHLRAAGYDDVADRCVLAVMSTAAWTAREVRAAVRQAEAAVPDVVSIPFDEQLGHAEPVDARRLRKPVRNALVELAGRVLVRCAEQPPAAVAAGAPS